VDLAGPGRGDPLAQDFELRAHLGETAVKTVQAAAETAQRGELLVDGADPVVLVVKPLVEPLQLGIEGGDPGVQPLDPSRQGAEAHLGPSPGRRRLLVQLHRALGEFGDGLVQAAEPACRRFHALLQLAHAVLEPADPLVLPRHGIHHLAHGVGHLLARLLDQPFEPLEPLADVLERTRGRPLVGDVVLDGPGEQLAHAVGGACLVSAKQEVVARLIHVAPSEGVCPQDSATLVALRSQ
jgi:hypothetical protein